MEWRKVSNIEAAKLLPHKNYDRAQLIIFSGKRGMGKTYAISHYIDVREPRTFILDPFNDFGKFTRSPTLESGLIDMVTSKNGPCVRRVVPPINEDSYAYAENFFQYAISNLRDCLIVMDEMTMWSGAHETENFRKLVLQGRRLRLRMLLATQRLSLLPGVALSESTEMCFFRLRRPRDLFVVKEWANAQVSAQVSQLNQGECMLGTSL